MAIYTDCKIVDGPVLMISGQTPQMGNGIPKTIDEQLDSVIGKINAIIEAQGCDKHNLVNMNVYLTSRDYVPHFRKKMAAYLDGHQPTMTLVIVSGLVHEAFKVEIDATVLMK